MYIYNYNYAYHWYLIHTGQNRYPSTEHDQYKVAGGSSTCYRGIVQQTSHPQGKMGEVTGSFFYQTVSMTLFSIFQLLYIRSLLNMLDFDWILGNCEEELPKKPVGRLSADSWPTDGRQVLPEI